MKRLAVFASGRGSNAQAIYDAIQRGQIDGQIVVLVTDKADAKALERAAQWGVAGHYVNPKDYESKAAYEEALIELLQGAEVDYVILAGFMRLFGPTMVEAYKGRILNIHPALLPSFTGLHAQKQAVDYGVRVSGCTVHFVDCGMDTGPIVAQAAVPVYPRDTEDSLSARILIQEHLIYPKVVAQLCAGTLALVDGRVVFTGDNKGDNYED